MTTYQNFLELLNKKRIYPLYLFQGKETSLIKEAVNRLKEYLFSDSQSLTLNYISIEEKERSISEIISICESLPFSSPKKLVVIDISKYASKEKEIFKEYLLNLPNHLHLVLIGEDLREFTIDSKDFLLVNFYPPFPSEVANKLRDFCLKNNIRLSGEAISYLLENFSSNWNFLKGELEKVLFYFPSRRIIDLNELSLILYPQREEGVFKLLEAIFQRNLKLSLSILKDLLHKGEAPLKIFFLINKHLRIIFQIKSLNLNLKTPSNTLERLNIRSRKQLLNLLSQAKNYSLSELKDILRSSIFVDKALKRESSSIYPIILELFIFKLCLQR
jgi:DNA polymerase-3 subunit delta